MERIRNLQAENLKLTEENKKLDKQLVQVGEDVYKVLLKQVEDLKKENDALNLVNDSLISEISVYKNSKVKGEEAEVIMLRKQVMDAEKIVAENEKLKMLLKENK